MNLTNIYDFTFSSNYLTNHEYVCFLQQEHVRSGIHAGGIKFNRGQVRIYEYNHFIKIEKEKDQYFAIYFCK